MFDKFIQQLNRDYQIKVSDKQKEQLKTYYQILIAYNKKVNLTRITDEMEVYFKHFYDSLTMAKAIDLLSQKTICDMGAGAGFPSIPLKIIFPHLKVTIVDSLGKRITFLEKLLEALHINDVELIYDRIETYAIKHQNEYDIVTARALGSLQLILELGIPMVKQGKYFIAYKGLNYDHEINDAKNAFHILSAKIKKIVKIDLPDDMGFRALLVIEKEKHINGYPRLYAIMKKKPL